MNNCIEILDPIIDNEFDESICRIGSGSFFTTSSWSKVLCETYGYFPYYFSLSSDEKLEAIIPLMEVNSVYTGKRAVSLPFSDYCEPVIKKNEHFKQIVDEIITFGKKKGWKYIDFRGGDKFFSGEPIYCSYYLHRIKIDKDEKKNISLLRDSTKRNISKSIKSGVVVDIYRDVDSIYTFYNLHKKTRKKHGVPPQPVIFFENIHKHVIRNKKGFFIIAKYNGKSIAAALIFLHSDEAIFKYSASDDKYYKLRPNNLVLWEAMRWCASNDYTKLNLGRTDTVSGGLLQFKRGWGGEEVSVNYYRYDMILGAFRPGPQRLNLMLKRLFQLTPVRILTKVGEVSYRHFG